MRKSSNSKPKLSMRKEVVRHLLGRDLTSVRAGKGASDWLECERPAGPTTTVDTGGDTCSCTPCAERNEN